ncbi:ABC transporter substrate-binding protein [uncultured Ferrovibrio sp.]|uniref:ABC transporter substrate-binding protein n=1 Tax=uncultured Ferrovibrio sp. TaxID=1576913 RepID=UPI0026294379|nr:ABC transporter substrate-binding protein [uncultured Ferrovibrio sp.]
MTMTSALRIAVLAISLGLLPCMAGAQELRIGLSTEPSSLDPDYHNVTPNNQIAYSIFNTLIQQDETQKLTPSLAESWRNLDDTTWEFKLRKGVKFHDGSPFTAADVVFSLARPAKVPNSPSPFTLFTRSVAEVKVIDDHTVHFITKSPTPLLPNDLSRVAIMSSKAAKPDVAEGITTDALNRGEGLIGTGPYRFVEWTRGNRLVLEANPNYWGGKPKWERVIYRPMSNDAARVAALLANDVDMIENPPPADIKRLRSNTDVKISEVLSNRLIYLALDVGSPTAGIPDADGKNPLQDRRVRKALSLAINREAITSRIVEGLAKPAGDLLPYPMFGARREAQPDPYNPDAAKKLLAEAGYPNGFSITIGSPNNRYINDSEVAQAIASQWTRVGVKSRVDAVPSTVFFKNRDAFAYSAALVGWAAGTGEMSNPLRSLIATVNREKGFGTANKSRYSNPALDALIEEALRTVNDKSRETLLQRGSQMALEDQAIVPLHFEITSWALRKGFSYKARADQYTLAIGVIKE